MEAAALITSLKGPWVLGGDFNMAPATLEATNWCKLVNGKIKASKRATCHSAVYDYFVVDSAIDHAVAGVQFLDDSGLYPHSPCRIYLRASARRKQIRKLIKPTRIPGRLPHGPPIKQISYNEVLEASRNGKSNAAMQAWYRTARKERATLTGVKDEYRKPKFAWESAVGQCAAQGGGAPHRPRLGGC